MSDAMAPRLALVPIFLCVLVVGACGSAKTETVSGQARAAATSSSSTTPQPVKVPTRPRKRRHLHRVVLTACDANIRVKAATTTCAFAQNVFYEYWKAAQSGQASSIDAYSAASGRTYTLTCARRTSIICRADDGSYVTFPGTAIDAYGADHAAKYACSGHLGPAEADACSGTDPGVDSKPPSGSADRCDPNYAGACLDPNSPDYDCAGGSGDGPDYTGQVEVIGNDHYGLDRDGDGIGCDDSSGSSSDPSIDYPPATPSDPSTDYPGAPTTEDFGSGSGSVGTCADGTLSDSIGRPGACSHHGGVG
jgi:hypothetical protein